MRLIDADKFPKDARITWVEHGEKCTSIRSVSLKDVETAEEKEGEK